MKRLFLIIMLLPGLCWGDCPNAIRLLPGAKNDECERIGLEVNAEKSVREDLVRGEYNAKIVDEQKRQLDIKDLTIAEYEKKTGLQGQEIERLRARNDSLENRSSTTFWLGLGAGIIVVLVGSIAIKNVAK